MQIERIKSVQDAGGGRYRCVVRFVGEAQDDIFWTDPNDPHGAGPAMRFRIATLQFDGEITPFVRPPPPVPEVVTAAQAKIALLDAGLLDNVETRVRADRKTLIWFDNATTWQRNSPRVTSLATAMGLTEQQVDDLFRAAAAVG